MFTILTHWGPIDPPSQEAALSWAPPHTFRAWD